MGLIYGVLMSIFHSTETLTNDHGVQDYSNFYLTTHCHR